MRKFTFFAIAILLTACNSTSKPTAKKDDGVIYKEGTASKTRIDSSYAVYSLGKSIQTVTSKVYIVLKDTALMSEVDSNTMKKKDTTIKTYFIPQVDTLFEDQAKRLKPQYDPVTKKTKSTIIWVPIDEQFILMDFKKK